MENEKDFLQWLKKEGFLKFQTKTISSLLKKEMNIPKIKVKIWISILKTNKLIIRKSESGYCKTTCASCYEYGCDSGIKPPVNFWQLNNQSETLNKK